MSPPHPRQDFGIRFSLLARAWRQALDARLASEGLTDATWVPLVHLAQTGGGISQKVLAKLVGVEAPSLVRVIDILERDGLLRRQTSEQDLRARLISLTPEGETRVRLIREALYEIETQFLAGIEDKALAEMLGHFVQIRSNIAAAGAEGTL